MKNLLLLLFFTLSLHSLGAQTCTGNTPIENLANGMDYTIAVGTAGVVDVTVTVVDNPAGLVGFLGGPGNPISFPDANGTFTYNLTGQATPYVLDMFFNWADGGQGNSTTVSCPDGTPPATTPSLPITFDDAAIDYELAPFGDNMSAALVADPTDPANMVMSATKEAGSQCWAGVTVGGSCLTDAIPFATEGLVISVDVYSPIAGSPILLKVENCGNGGISSEVIVTTTVANEWETLTFDFASGCPGAPDLNNTYDKISVFPQFVCEPDACGNANPAPGIPATADAYFFDNVQMQVLALPSLPITFDDAGVDYNLAGFGGAIGTLETDPLDPANEVLGIQKPAGSEVWGGVVVGDAGLAEAIPLAGNRLTFTVDVYSPKAGATMLLKIENTANGAIASEVAATVTAANTWETLTFDLSAGTPGVNLDNVYDKVVIFPDFGNNTDLNTDLFYFDNVILLPAFGPIPVAPSIPIAFGEPNTIYNLSGFGGASGVIVADPLDPTNEVIAITKPAGSECWGGVTVGEQGLETEVPFTAGELEMRMDVYSPVAGATILLKVEDAANPGISAEVSATTTAANTWETLVFDFSNSLTAPIDLNNTYDKISIFPQFCAALPLTSEPHFFDNIRMTTLPYLECRQPTSTVNTEGLCGAVDLIVLDPFILDPDEVGISDYTLTNNAPAFYPIGTTDVTYTWMNTAGVTSSCEQEVIIEDAELATVAPCDTANGFCSANSCFATIEIDPEITDNCGVASVSGTGTFTYEVGLHEHIVTVTDVNGNVTTHIIDVAIHDGIAPEFNNCPSEQVVLATSTFPTSLMPTASDNCGMDGVTNDIPAAGLPAGESTVTFTAEDAYGNTTDCEISVMVGAGEIISLHPASDIGATLAEDENSQVVTWNPLNATTQCSYCEETSLEGFTFVGNYWGHQYFLADEVSLTRQDAQLIAEGYDAHLAVISTAGENNYLKEALSNEVRTAWIGLMPQNVNGAWSFVWDNDEANVFNALDLDMNEVNANTRIVLSQDGDWVDATNTEEKYFLIERPCVDFTQVGPYAPGTELGSTQLLRSGDAWPEGDYEVVYSAVDMCGNESQLSFDVTVQPEVSEFCTTAGTDNSVWIEGVTFHEMTSTSASNAGYADFAETVTTMNIGDGVVLLDLTAGGNTTDEVLYWRVWLDRNNDGDFFDAGEVLFEQSTDNAHLQTNVALAQEAVSNARLRVAVARHAFPAPCGNPYVGEVEDYTVTLTLPAVIDVERVPQIQVFPNPADTYVNVDLSDFAGEEVTIRVINNLGKSVSFVKETVNVKGQVRLDLQGITGGMYNVSVSTAKRQVSKRFVVSNVRRMTTAR